LNNTTDTTNHPSPLDVWTISRILTWTKKRFEEALIDTPLLDAQLLLCEALKCRKVDLYLTPERPLSPEERAFFRSLVKRRLQGEPIAYILNKSFWHTLELYVDKRVLIPRPETESLLDFVLHIIKTKKHTPLKILDLCTGSGCLAIALAKAYPNAQVVGIDISKEALEVAKQNAHTHEVSPVFIEGDIEDEKMFESLKKTYESFDIIVSNPPYVAYEEWEDLDISVKDYEPSLALIAKKEGLHLGETILKTLNHFELLSPQGVFAMEMGVGHPSKLLLSLTSSYKDKIFSLKNVS
jgi:release factor glutamine methyltransferase